eukprot:s4215_g5.t1
MYWCIFLWISGRCWSSCRIGFKGLVVGVPAFADSSLADKLDPAASQPSSVSGFLVVGVAALADSSLPEASQPSSAPSLVSSSVSSSDSELDLSGTHGYSVIRTVFSSLLDPPSSPAFAEPFPRTLVVVVDFENSFLAIHGSMGSMGNGFVSHGMRHLREGRGSESYGTQKGILSGTWIKNAVL